MKSYKSRIPRLLVAPAIAAAASGTSMGQIVTEDFESYTDGSPIPNQTFTALEEPPQDPPPTNDQITAAAGLGVDGSQAAEYAVATVPSLYRFKLNSGVAGTYYQVSTKFKMSINELAPSMANHAIVSVGFSNQPEWWNGQIISANIVRRNGGLRYGMSGFGKDTAGQQPWQVTGWEQNSEIGLPNELPLAGATAESGWFTLTMTIQDTGTTNVDPLDSNNERTQWDITGTVKDENGNIVFSLTVEDRLITDGAGNLNTPAADGAVDLWAPGDTLYAAVSLPWGGSGTATVVADGAVETLVADDVRIGAVSSSDADTDMDSYSDAIELANGSDPLDAASDPETLFSTGFTAAEGFSDTVVTVDDMGTPDPSDDVTTVTNSLNGQVSWLGQNTRVGNTDSFGEVCAVSQGFFLRNRYSEGVRGGANGVASTEGDFVIGRAIEIVLDYQFTLGENDPILSTNLGKFGIIPDGTANIAPTQGFSAKYNVFNPDSNGGQMKFFADTNNENRMAPDPNPEAEPGAMINVENQYAFFLSGNDVGVDPFDDRGHGVDLESDDLQITYNVTVAGELDEFGFWNGVMTVDQFKVKNLATNAEFVYDLSGAPEPVSFNWVDEVSTFPYQDAFFAFQFDRNGASNGVVDCLKSVTVKHKLIPEVVVPTSDLDIVSIQMLDADTVEIQFAGEATTEYKLTSSADLVTPFADTTATNVTTDGSGAGTFTYDLPAPVAAKDFFQIAEVVPAS